MLAINHIRAFWVASRIPNSAQILADGLCKISIDIILENFEEKCEILIYMCKNKNNVYTSRDVT